VLVDDAETLLQSAPVEADRLADLAADGVVAVVATTTTLAAGIAHRGLLAQLRATRTGVVLCPVERGSQDVFGAALDDAVEPGVRLPGRGALVVDGAVTAVQLAVPADPQDASPRPDGLSAASSPRPRGG
jgi:S-DNA-T family DNA segregation ATPase FtsK/SpoIIIE